MASLHTLPACHHQRQREQRAGARHPTLTSEWAGLAHPFFPVWLCDLGKSPEPCLIVSCLIQLSHLYSPCHGGKLHDPTGDMDFQKPRTRPILPLSQVVLHKYKSWWALQGPAQMPLQDRGAHSSPPPVLTARVHGSRS